MTHAPLELRLGRSGRGLSATLAVVVGLALVHFSIVSAAAEQRFEPKSFVTSSKFTLNGRVLITKSAFVVLTDEFFSGQTKALKILFSSEAMTEEAKADILKNDGKMIRQKDHAFLVLFIDKNNQIWQVNFTFVVPGQTVARTIAWKPEDLEKFSSKYVYDGNRLKFHNKGNYRDPESEKDPINLTWDVGFDLPVFQSTSINRK